MKEKKYLAWLTDFDTIMKVYDLAKKRGKKTGDNIQQEFFEVMENVDSHIKLLGQANKENIESLADRVIKEIERKKNETNK
jgi:hypothetical protein